VKLVKRLQQSHRYRRWMLACVALATLLRLVLIYCNWPFTESDEGNMGLLALHVAFQGEHPVFFYGGPYLGPLEGYAAAPLFRLFGSSLFALRLPLVLFFAIFLLSMYYLVLLLYRSEKFALVSVILLGLGSPDVLFLQLRASGEYPEIEMFAALMCLLGVWLALTSRSTARQPGVRDERKRLAVYALLGLIIGLALWVDLLILPFVAAVGLLLCFFCWRELLRWCGLSLVFGLVIGAFPLISYNLTAPWSQNSWFVLLRIHDQGAAALLAQHLTWLNEFTGTMFVALPMATGGSLHCPLSAVPPSGSPTPATLPCLIFQGGWSLGYLVLWLCAAGLAAVALWRRIRQLRARLTPDTAPEDRQEFVRQAGRLVVLASVGLTLFMYAIAPSPAISPDTSFRYLTCLLLALPVLLWPIWQGLRPGKISWQWCVKGALFLLVIATLTGGTVETLTQIPSAQAEYQSKEAVVQDLLHIGATRVYSDYWTCNILTFLSKEKIICSALDESLNPGYDRYEPYRGIVQAAPYPAYIFPIGAPQARAMQQRVARASSQYQQYSFEGYMVYQTRSP
jgi:4-amino-4-deoxy-L-arabinose transferase-like glycosyltransferase